MIKGITVTLYTRTQSSTDALGNPIYTEASATVENVLVAPVSQQEQVNSSPAELTGRRAVYQMAIPKGDAHTWLGNRVSFFGRTWQVIGDVRTGIEDMMPLDWKDIYQVECIDG